MAIADGPFNQLLIGVGHGIRAVGQAAVLAFPGGIVLAVVDRRISSGRGVRHVGVVIRQIGARVGHGGRARGGGRYGIGIHCGGVGRVGRAAGGDGSERSNQEDRFDGGFHLFIF